MNTKDADRIAFLINSVIVWKDIAAKHLEDNNMSQHFNAVNWEYDAVIALHDEFGITLPTYESSLAWRNDRAVFNDESKSTKLRIVT